MLSLESTRQQTLAAHAAQRSAFLSARAVEQERRRNEIERLKYELEEKKRREERARVWKVAPGFDAQTTLVPKKIGANVGADPHTSTTGDVIIAGSGGTATGTQDREEMMMADLVESLAKLDAAHSLL